MGKKDNHTPKSAADRILRSPTANPTFYSLLVEPIVKQGIDRNSFVPNVPLVRTLDIVADAKLTVGAPYDEVKATLLDKLAFADIPEESRAQHESKIESALRIIFQARSLRGTNEKKRDDGAEPVDSNPKSPKLSGGAAAFINTDEGRGRE